MQTRQEDLYAQLAVFGRRVTGGVEPRVRMFPLMFLYPPDRRGELERFFSQRPDREGRHEVALVLDQVVGLRRLLQPVGLHHFVDEALVREVVGDRRPQLLRRQELRHAGGEDDDALPPDAYEERLPPDDYDLVAGPVECLERGQDDLANPPGLLGVRVQDRSVRQVGVTEELFLIEEPCFGRHCRRPPPQRRLKNKRIRCAALDFPDGLLPRGRRGRLLVFILDARAVDGVPLSRAQGPPARRRDTEGVRSRQRGGLRRVEAELGRPPGPPAALPARTEGGDGGGAWDRLAAGRLASSRATLSL